MRLPSRLATPLGASILVMVLTTASNTILQTIVDEEQCGRVMSCYTMAFMGTAP